MNKRKKWQFFIILTVLALTIYNILPTIFYYCKSLKSPVEQRQADQIAQKISQRVNDLEEESIEWLRSFCTQISVKPKDISIEKNNPQLLQVAFFSSQDALKFKSFLPKAGALRPFTPSKLALSSMEKDPKTITIQRLIPTRFNLEELNSYYKYGKKYEENGRITSFYRDLIYDRVTQIAYVIAGANERSVLLNHILENQTQEASAQQIFNLADYIIRFDAVFQKHPEIAKRFFANFWKFPNQDPKAAYTNLMGLIDHVKDRIKSERITLQEKHKKIKEEGKFVEESDSQSLRSLERKETMLVQAKSILKKNEPTLTKKASIFTKQSVLKILEESFSLDADTQLLSLKGLNPFVESLSIDWKNNKISLNLYPDIISLKKSIASSSSYEKDQFQHLIFNEIASITRLCDEQFIAQDNQYTLKINKLQDAQSFLCLDLTQIANSYARQMIHTVLSSWKPKHPELQTDKFPVLDFETYKTLPPEQQSLCLTIMAPVLLKDHPHGMKNGSIYFIAKGLDKILHKYQNYSDSEDAQIFMKDFQALKEVLSQFGFIGYPASLHVTDKNYLNDFIFEKDDFSQNILHATREDFYVIGSKKFAVLEFSNLEQRILTQNQIDTKIHEDLLKWKDEYNAAQVSLDETAKYSVPSPNKNMFLSNAKLSFLKYFRGDERKVLHWGLDLSGGKTVSIELRDQNNKIVKNEEDLKQGMNELYTRVNKMGVSEVNIRIEGNKILLDFPGSQNLSASDLVKASSMYFHLINEKFSPFNSTLHDAVNHFLQEVWNEAVVMNQKDAEGVNAIAWKHLYGDSKDSSVVQPRSEAAKILYDNGLRLASIYEDGATSSYNDSYSKIAVYRGESFTKWAGQTHPLVVVFRNYALDGASLANIRSSYDPSKGNFLSFEVKNSILRSDGTKFNPRTDFHAWTSQFSKENVQGTPNEKFTNGKGWRMAVILNDTIISAPTLDSSLKDSAMISGSFSQREANQLAADLKAGSLTFTPKILSEKNVSPELGKQDRFKGILATIFALILVVSAMITYYRFAGLVASVAVIFNLIIMWAALQNLQAVLSLAGIAGIILTVGMAVDANVLVFERIREEFSISRRLSSAVHAGYKKAFSAILDSNVTTIIAALILLNFDSGPIKGFAITLIIGIASSMFTSLFMTRFFFSKWVENPNHQNLTMMNWIKPSQFDFLKNSKFIVAISTVLILTGLFSAYGQKNTLFGMDFTGGHSLNVELVGDDHLEYRSKVEKALIQGGASSQDFSIRELTPSNNLRIMLGTSLENKGKPFYQMPLTAKDSQINPRIQWIIQSLQEADLQIKPSHLKSMDTSFSSVSGQMSDTMRNNAIIGLFLALLAIMCYITIRFEWKYSLSAIICLVHDVLVSIGFIAILHALGVTVQIDLNTVAALMTIIGYSLNDTIIVFDRIREDLHLLRKQSLKTIVNHALNVTLSRTLMTSVTTMLVLLALVGLGGGSIFSFALVMCVGVIFGTLSSLFIASPLMLAFHKWENRRDEKFLSSRKA